jgi:environmental stress-induced protein Ves
MLVRKLVKTDYVEQTWKNGQGVTREIARDTDTPFRWRLSLAEVSQSGDFSSFPGYDRILVQCSGEPFRLRHGSASPKELSLFSPYRFRGDWETHVDIKSPARDLNLMTLDGKAKAALSCSTVKGNDALQFSLSGSEHFLFCWKGSVRIENRNSNEQYQLEDLECLRITRSPEHESLALRVEGESESMLLWAVVHIL